MHTLLTLTYFSYFVTIPLQWGMPLISSTNCYVDYQLPISMPHEVLMVVCSDLVGEAATTATIWKTCWNVKASTTTAVRFIAESRDASQALFLIIRASSTCMEYWFKPGDIRLTRLKYLGFIV